MTTLGNRIMGTGCSIIIELLPGHQNATVTMSGVKKPGSRCRVGKFNAEACEKIAKQFAELAELLKCAEVNNS